MGDQNLYFISKETLREGQQPRKPTDVCVIEKSAYDEINRRLIETNCFLFDVNAKLNKVFEILENHEDINNEGGPNLAMRILQEIRDPAVHPVAPTTNELQATTNTSSSAVSEKEK